ncbi:hypothetical protein BAC2_01109 [uncultured bacterium]|nr:hypothetical protein BAC2_01109 [uncultured bacterium]
MLTSWWAMCAPFLYSPDDGGGGSGGGDDKTDDKKTDDKKTEDKKDGKGTGEKKEYTQEQLDAMFAERAKSAGSAATKALLDKFGAKTVDDLDAALKKAKELEEAQLSEADKAKKAAEQARKEADEAKSNGEAAIARANERLMQAEIKAQATAQKFRKEAIDDVWLLVKSDAKMLEKLKVKEDGSVDGAEAIVKDVAKARAHWLDSGSGGKGTPRPGDKKPEPDKEQPRGYQRRTSSL